MKSISTKLVLWGLMSVAGGGSLAHATTDLPGGPAVNQLNLHPAVTRIAHEQHYLHWMMLIICTVIFIGVFAVMFYSIWKHRKSRGAKADRKSTRLNSSHPVISYAVFCLKKKKRNDQ